MQDYCVNNLKLVDDCIVANQVGMNRLCRFVPLKQGSHQFQKENSTITGCEILLEWSKDAVDKDKVSGWCLGYSFKKNCFVIFRLDKCFYNDLDNNKREIVLPGLMYVKLSNPLNFNGFVGQSQQPFEVSFQSGILIKDKLVNIAIVDKVCIKEEEYDQEIFNFVPKPQDDQN